MSAEANILQESNENRMAYGDYGLRVLTAAETSVSGEYFHCLHATEASVIDFTSSPDEGGGDGSASNLSIPAGFQVFGNLTDVTVDSGTVIAYLRKF